MEKNIAYVIPSLQIGGAELQTINQLNFLWERGGRNIYCIVLTNEIEIIKKLILPSSHILILENNTESTLKDSSIKQLIKSIEKFNHFINDNYITDLLAISPLAQLYCRVSKIFLLFKQKIRIHAYYRGDYYSTAPINTISKYFFNKIHSILAALTDNTTLFISNVVLNDIKKNFYIKNPIVLPNSLPLKNISVEKANAYLNKKNIKVDNSFIIIFPGRFHWQKGHDFFINCIKNFKTYYEKPNKKILIFCCGNGPEKVKIEAKVKDLELVDHVIFTGKIDNELLLSFYKKSNLVVIPSLHEGFGNVCIEGLMQKSVMLVSDVGGLSTIIQDGVNGFKFEKLNEAEFINKLLLIYESEFELLNPEKIFNSFIENYTIDKQIKKIIQHCSLPIEIKD